MPSEVVTIDGLKELNAKLKSLATKEANRITRRGITRMATVIRKEMRARAPKKTGFLRKNLAYKITKDNRGGFIGTVGPKDKAYYARFLEFGSAAHLIPGATKRRLKALQIKGQIFTQVQHPGTRPKPFLRPAYEATKMRAVEEAGQVMWKLIEEALAK
jgi:HK97 gp10 family phage protein